MLLRGLEADGRVHLTFGISGSRLIPPTVGVPAGKPLTVSLVSLDRRKHVLGLAGRPSDEVFGNVPHSVRQPALAPGRHRIVLDGATSAGTLYALTPTELRRAELRERRLGAPKRPVTGGG